MELFNLEEFLNSGMFVSSPQENKIWCMYESIEKYQSNENLAYPYFYFSDFYFKNGKSFFKGNKFFEFSIETFQNILERDISEIPDIKWNKFDDLFYKNQYDLIKNSIKNKNIQKGVPFSFLPGNFEIDNKNKLYFIKNIIKNIKNNKCHLYGFWEENKGIIGASPELIFLQENNSIFTIALAGTIKNEINVDIDKFLHDPKMNNEHNFVIEGIKKSLNLYGEVKIGQTTIFELPHLIHLKTDIYLNLNSEFNFLKLVNLLHPTPAVGIYPKNNQFWIEESFLNSSQRKNFAAPFGIMLSNKKSFCVCLIRGIEWDNFDVQITAGGGVINESIYQEEMNEIKFKIQSIIKNLGLNYEF
ncbi:chorismate-binding protein [Pigmentibacter sp. JX0631]|uniref:chorismate-binding protein n=1 Tax=Pigmentibacter sp. JX0631 TaxID=2976982 RepID=UPI0024696CCC|nr:chorismate-binding protein [Pigmentibacter sp. JX0631]WGL61301.1 chorismate-binding protein [Pigmentibacter sp. JX0631]